MALAEMELGPRQLLHLSRISFSVKPLHCLPIFVARITMFISQQNRFSTHYCYFSPNNYEDISSLYKKLSLNMVYEKILKELILIYTN